MFYTHSSFITFFFLQHSLQCPLSSFKHSSFLKHTLSFFLRHLLSSFFTTPTLFLLTTSLLFLFTTPTLFLFTTSPLFLLQHFSFYVCPLPYKIYTFSPSYSTHTLFLNNTFLSVSPIFLSFFFRGALDD